MGREIGLYASNKMNIGGSILDVTVTKSYAGGTVTSVPMESEVIVADGVVQAAGYSPVIITKTATNTPTAPSNQKEVSSVTPSQPNVVEIQSPVGHTSTDRVGDP